MLIAARNAMMAGGGWKNPYPVMDSCIAWWDSKWNIGIERYDANATTWKDLIGTSDFSNVKFKSDGCYVINNSTSALSYSNVITIEIVGAENSTAANRFGFSNGLNLFNIDSNPAGYGQFGFYGHNNSARGQSIFKNFFSNRSMVFRKTGEETFSVYNVPTRMSYNGTSGTGVFSVIIGMGTQSVEYGPYTGIRLHTRYLTDTELSRNYAVDKARFGLP